VIPLVMLIGTAKGQQGGGAAEPVHAMD